MTALIYILLEWKFVSSMAASRVSKGMPTMSGKRWHYVLGSAATTFVGISAFYFGIISYANAGINLTCWFLPSICMSLLMGGTVFKRLDHVEFKGK
jgi:hypothetical protein